MVILKKFKDSDMFINITRISTGTILGQIISFMTIPIFSRIYGAEIIGIWTFFNTFAIIINSFSDFGLTNSIMIEEDEDNVIETYRVVNNIVTIISIISGILYWVYNYFFGENNYNMNLTFLAIYIMIAIYTLQQTQICYTWLNRKKEYKVLMKNPMINNLAFGIVGISFGLMGVIKYGYFLGWLSGQIITLMHMKKYLPSERRIARIEEFRRVFFRNKDFCIFQLPTNIISHVKNQIPTLFIKYLFGNIALGQYSITIRVINVPINLLGNAIGRVFFQRASEMKRENKNVGYFTYNNMMRAMKIAVIPVVILMSLGDIIFNVLLGPGWDVAGNIIRLLGLQAFFMFLIMSSQGIAITINKQKYNMVAGIIQIVFMGISLIVGKVIFSSLYIGLILLSITFIVINIVYFCYLFKAMNVSWKKYIVNISINILIILIGYLIIRGGLYIFGLVNGF